MLHLDKARKGFLKIMPYGQHVVKNATVIHRHVQGGYYCVEATNNASTIISKGKDKKTVNTNDLRVICIIDQESHTLYPLLYSKSRTAVPMNTIATFYRAGEYGIGLSM